MARDWVKLHTRLLDDAEIMGLSAETGWTLTRMIVLAGRNEDNGRIGTPKNVAYVLHTTVAAISAAVAELDGRVTVADDGELWFRDWQENQSQSERERQRAHRASKAPVTDAEEPEVVTTGHDPSRLVTAGHVSESSSRTKPDQTSSEETTPPPPAVPPASANGSTPQTAGREGHGKQGSVSKAKPAKSARPRDVLFDAWCSVQGFDPDNPGGKAGLARQFSARCQRLVPVPTPADVVRFVDREKARQVDGAPAWGTVTKSNTFSDTFVGWWQSGAPALRIVPKNGRATPPPAADGPDDWGWGTEPIPADPTLQEAAR